MGAPVDRLLTAWTCFVLTEWNGREYVALSEVRVWTETLLLACELVFDQDEMARVRQTAAGILERVCFSEE